MPAALFWVWDEYMNNSLTPGQKERDGRGGPTMGAVSNLTTSAPDRREAVVGGLEARRNSHGMPCAAEHGKRCENKRTDSRKRAQAGSCADERCRCRVDGRGTGARRAQVTIRIPRKRTPNTSFPLLHCRSYHWLQRQSVSLTSPPGRVLARVATYRGRACRLLCNVQHKYSVTAI